MLDILNSISNLGLIGTTVVVCIFLITAVAVMILVDIASEEKKRK